MAKEATTNRSAPVWGLGSPAVLRPAESACVPAECSSMVTRGADLVRRKTAPEAPARRGREDLSARENGRQALPCPDSAKTALGARPRPHCGDEQWRGVVQACGPPGSGWPSHDGREQAVPRWPGLHRQTHPARALRAQEAGSRGVADQGPHDGDGPEVRWESGISYGHGRPPAGSRTFASRHQLRGNQARGRPPAGSRTFASRHQLRPAADAAARGPATAQSLTQHGPTGLEFHHFPGLKIC